jgi:hypothetical protein
MTPKPPYMMPFGKHKGTPLGELEFGYVAWLQTKIDEWRDPFRQALLDEIDRRKAEPTPATEAVEITAEALIVAGARALRQRHAGDVDVQNKITRVAGEVRAALSTPRKPAWLDPEPTAEVPF